jgi:hypothetical protein
VSTLNEQKYHIGTILAEYIIYFSASPVIYFPECLIAMLAGISNNVI